MISTVLVIGGSKAGVTAAESCKSPVSETLKRVDGFEFVALGIGRTQLAEPYA